jgi:hypothetical protein
MFYSAPGDVYMVYLFVLNYDHLTAVYTFHYSDISEKIFCYVVVLQEGK